MATTGLNYGDIFTGKVPGSGFWWLRATADEVVEYRRRKVEELVRLIEMSDENDPDHWVFDPENLNRARGIVCRCDDRLAELGVALPAGETPTPPPSRGSVRWFKTAPLCELFAYVEERRKACARSPMGKGLDAFNAHVVTKTRLRTAERRLARRLGTSEAQFLEAAE